MSRNNVRLFVRCYLAAALFWVLVVLLGLAKQAWFGSNGLYRQQEVSLDELTMVSAKPYDNSDYPGEGWFVTTDSDPQLIWQGDIYLERVVLQLKQTSPPNGVELYYLTGDQTDWTPRQLVYAVRDAEGRYIFDLRGKHVTSLRIDPDSEGAIITQFQGLTLNAPMPFYKNWIPTGGQAVLLQLLPAVFAAAVMQLRRWFEK